VFDTNALVSRLVVPGSVAAKALQKGMETGDLLVSDDTLEELAEVLARPKFKKYLTHAERRRFFALLGRVALRVEILRPIQACRDPKDDKFLALAVNGEADAFVTGDGDLLALHPFLGIPVLTPSVFLARAPDVS
jgi:putative PIN family toxin of toxin-antitoxin system